MKPDDNVRTFTRPERLRAAVIGWAGYVVINLIGRTMRWESAGQSYLDEIHRSGHRAVFSFWHGAIAAATFYYRNRGIVVMTSQNLDGEGIAQCIRRFGYVAARGSSSRGGLRALAEMARAIRSGQDCGFSVDGPRGPRHVAKMGPVLLAFKTGAPIFCFHIAVKRRIQLRSWDRFEIPLPFTRAVVLQSPPIWVPHDASEKSLRAHLRTAQAALDALRLEGERWRRQA